jgi:L-histidine N-alpha-methyltransferase
MLKPLASHAANRLRIMNYLGQGDNRETGQEILAGLRQPQKLIPSKYFYDAHGSWLFEQICSLPEYYLTRTELSILRRWALAFMAFFLSEAGDLVELGSGSDQKVNILLKAATGAALRNLRYVPVDISASALHGAALELLERFPDLHVLGIIADFTRHLDFLSDRRKLILFLGSTIGNFSRDERIAFLRRVATSMRPPDRLVVGLDMLKPAGIIEAAYNDSQGVTAEFNKNILYNLNRQFDGDFKVDDFEHLAFFRADKARVEMHLRARRSTSARMADLNLSVHCEPGETIRTEICQKFSREQANLDFQAAGLVARRWLTDPDGWFSLVIAEKSGL